MLQIRVERFVLCAALLLMAAAADAKICKTVGPDGTVVYTDRPVASCNTETEPTPATPAPAKTAPKAESPSAPDSTVEKAVIGVLGLEDMVERTRAFCVKVLPTSSRRYDAAADQWKERNAAAVAKTRRALAQTFVPQQQQLISDGVKARNEQSLERVVSSPKASQIKWCDQSAADIEARALDPKENLTAPLAAY